MGEINDKEARRIIGITIGGEAMYVYKECEPFTKQRLLSGEVFFIKGYMGPSLKYESPTTPDNAGSLHRANDGTFWCFLVCVGNFGFVYRGSYMGNMVEGEVLYNKCQGAIIETKG